MLLPLVFLAGIGSMATEICASRLLAPFYGSSTVVWANIIGLILAALPWATGSAGAWPTPARARACWASWCWPPRPWSPPCRSSRGPFSTSRSAASRASRWARWSVRFSPSLLLFAPPVVLLGMVTPFAVRLAVTDVAAAGVVAGRIFALSTAGSLLGTFVPALLTIPLIGTQRTLLGAATVVALAAALLLGRRWLLAGLAVALLLALPPGLVKPEPGVIYEGESRYQFIEVVQQGSGAMPSATST